MPLDIRTTTIAMVGYSSTPSKNFYSSSNIASITPVSWLPRLISLITKSHLFTQMTSVNMTRANVTKEIAAKRLAKIGEEQQRVLRSDDRKTAVFERLLSQIAALTLT